jgi:hypothetical protein
MFLAHTARKALVGASLMTIAMSFVLDPSFATDIAAVPEPATTTLLALVGVAGLAVGFIRRRKK